MLLKDLQINVHSSGFSLGMEDGIIELSQLASTWVGLCSCTHLKFCRYEANLATLQFYLWTQVFV